MRLSEVQLKCVKHAANNRGIKLQQLLDLGYNEMMINYIIHKEQALTIDDGRVYVPTQPHLAFKLTDKKFIVDTLPYCTLTELWGRLHFLARDRAKDGLKGATSAQEILSHIAERESRVMELAS